MQHYIAHTAQEPHHSADAGSLLSRRTGTAWVNALLPSQGHFVTLAHPCSTVQLPELHIPETLDLQ